MNDTVKIINECLEKSELTDLKPWYRTNKYGDWILDHIPYGWRVYYKYCDVKLWFKSTYQKIRYGVSNEECWSLDHTITRFILPRLKHFKNMKRHAYPGDITPEEWESILDELIWTFEYMSDDGETANPFPNLWKPNEDGKSYLGRERTEEEKELYRVWDVKHKELEERKEKGLQLFVKYYQHLWD